MHAFLKMYKYSTYAFHVKTLVIDIFLDVSEEISALVLVGLGLNFALKPLPYSSYEKLTVILIIYSNKPKMYQFFIKFCLMSIHLISYETVILQATPPCDR